MVDTASTKKLRVFISYSRDDLAFADQLDAVLGFHGFVSTIDRHGISAGEDWKRRLGNLIRDADTVVFVLSPASAVSEICAWEVEEALRLGKRIIPVLCRPLEDARPPPHLAGLNYIFFYPEPKSPGSGFGVGQVQLASALDTDVEWLRDHTRYLQRASEWDAGGRPTNRLLSGADIEIAKAWAARRPSEAPILTSLQLDFLKASEEWDKQQQSAERQRLQQMAEAQNAREAALAEKEKAQKREAAQARRVVQRTLAGLVAALALAGVAGFAGWNAHIRRLEVERERVNLAAANRRLSAKMKLRIAPFGTRAYSISEQWYKLATTNASSIAFVIAGGGFASGFIMKGKDLYAPWGDEDVFVTAGHVVQIAAEARSAYIYLPAVDAKHKVPLGDVLWRSHEGDRPANVDVVIMRLAGKLPRGARHINAISDLGVHEWDAVTYKDDAVTSSVLEETVPLITLGAAVESYDKGKGVYGDTRYGRPFLALSLANALGRDSEGELVLTDSTTFGSSGTPIFDANDGRVVAIVQRGSAGDVKSGLAYSGGFTLNAVKKAINATYSDSLAWGRWLALEGRDEDAKAQFTLALARSPDASEGVNAAWVEVYLRRGREYLHAGKDEDAKAQFTLALARSPDASKQVDAAWGEAYVRRGRNFLTNGKDEDAKAQFALAVSRDPKIEERIGVVQAEKFIDRGQKLLKVGNEEEAGQLFALARTVSTGLDERIENAWINGYLDQGSKFASEGHDDEAKKAFERALLRDGSITSRINERWALVHNHVAWQRFMENKPAEGLPHAELAVAFAPSNSSVLDSRGHIYLALGRIDAAFGDFDKAIRHGSNAPGTYFGRGRAQELKGNREEAIADYRKTIEVITVADRMVDEYDKQADMQARARLGVLGVSAESSDEDAN
jgi:tetratricopeptide (TPR) repeat protein